MSRHITFFTNYLILVQKKVSTKKRFSLFLVTILSALLLSGCQSTKPSWYSEPEVNNAEYLYAVAEARNLSQAKKMAVNNLNENLWTQVKSSSHIRETVREKDNEGSFNILVDNKVNTKTETLTLNGIEFMQMEENDLGAFVKVRIKKSLVTQQLKRELQDMNLKAEHEISNIRHQDKLLWWLKNRTAYQLKHDAAVRISMLAPLDPSYIADTSSITRYTETYQKVSSELYFRLSYDSSSKKAAQFLGEQISEFNIATSTSKRRNQTHTLNVVSEKRRKKIAGAYISTLVSQVKVSNSQNKTVSRSEVISTGSSVTSYKYADEGAARHFDDQIREKGIWVALGLIN
ncbi:LPP20 family lipoprotein [Vibrio hepatarius]|uniref:LPP20 family lipoprotein n=1 Tax=Vibrio hepatarius TaxID=171383 RepID=UPI00142E83A9|nr:LPP20 family lipoprotein [Vibrio hepatarius]NIY82975.1 hypothetical protein [Vibrio hepatarius]